MAKFKYTETANCVTVGHEALPGEGLAMSTDNIGGLVAESPVALFLVKRGIKAYMQDSCSGETPSEVMATVKELWAALVKGEVPTGRERKLKAPKHFDILQAMCNLAAAKGKTVKMDQAQAYWTGLTKEARETYAARPEIVAEVAKIRAERAAQDKVEDVFGGLFD